MKKENKLCFVPLVGKTSACRQKEGLKLIKGLPLLPRLAAVLPPQGREITRGFTLIELLVVVLIITILAAIAVPQYQKAVWKARAVQLRVAVQALAQAQEQYYLIHGTYPTAFSQLDIAFDSFPEHPKGYGHAENYTSSNDAIRRNEWVEIILNNSGTFKLSTGIFMQGKYDAAGFMYMHEDKSKKVSPGFYCVERVNKGSKFCQQIMGLAGNSYTEIYGFKFYRM